MRQLCNSFFFFFNTNPRFVSFLSVFELRCFTVFEQLITIERKIFFSRDSQVSRNSCVFLVVGLKYRVQRVQTMTTTVVKERIFVEISGYFVQFIF